jgi:hypothetical protein
MRATQMTPAFFFQKDRQPNWMAHTPVGHDSLLWVLLSTDLRRGLVQMKKAGLSPGLSISFDR